MGGGYGNYGGYPQQFDYGYQKPVYDGKRMRKAVQRRTVDYGSPASLSFERRVFQRDRRDYFGIQPSSAYIPELLTPFMWEDNSSTSYTTKFVHSSMNKQRHPVNQVIWTPEGRRLITGISSGEFTLWNGLTFNFETLLQAHQTAVRAMIWSHDDEWMVSCDDGGYIKYYQSSMNNVKSFLAHNNVVRALAFSPTDSKLASCSDDKTIRIWDFARTEQESVLEDHRWDVKCVAWHPSKAMLVSGSKDSTVRFWDPRSVELVHTINEHKSTVVEVEINQNGNWLLTASRDQTMKLFDLRTMKELQLFRGHDKEVTSAVWHPFHERMFCSGGADGTILFWEVGMEHPTARIHDAHEKSIWSLAWHPAGHILCSGGNDQATKFWTRNRPGDTMDDKHNSSDDKGVMEISTFGGSMSAAYSNTTTLPTRSTIPGMGYQPSDAMYSPFS